ncbi:lysophospholipid acyltransferase family protein [Roseovarius sp. MBR-6]|jgi:lauroyl/myristoyl acyltransferase|uniref:lysophospholipid acyltransferase family protein n=1 Tax=Roseovarius sp. MBR-6 TaxID=3156459 RepID=UPI003399633F
MAKYYLLPKSLMDRLPGLQTPVWLLEAGVFHLLYGLARLMPVDAAGRVFGWLLGTLGKYNPNKQRPVRRNLAVVMPEADEATRERVMREIFRSTGLAAVELFLLDRIWRGRDRYLEFSVHPEAEALIRRKAPIVFATAHTGAWQLTSLIGRKHDLSIAVLYAPDSNPWMDRFFLARRRHFGGPLVPSAGGARDTLRELAAGRSVGAAFDTRIDEGEPVPFFGVPAMTNTLPAMLALRGYPLIPIRAVRLPGARYRIEVMAPLAPADTDAPRKDQVLELTARLNAVFEGWIREDPGQWLCMKRRWPKPRPPRAADV